MRLRAVRRPGLSLLEVIVAMAVFLFSLVSLGHLMNASAALAMNGHYKSEATNLALSRLADLAAGSIPLEAQGDAPLEEDPDYTWSMQADASGTEGLYNVTVTVSRKKNGGGLVTASLSQMMLDPNVVGSVFDTAGATTDTTADMTEPAATDTPAPMQAPCTSAMVGHLIVSIRRQVLSTRSS